MNWIVKIKENVKVIVSSYLALTFIAFLTTMITAISFSYYPINGTSGYVNMISTVLSVTNLLLIIGSSLYFIRYLYF